MAKNNSNQRSQPSTSSTTGKVVKAKKKYPTKYNPTWANTRPWIEKRETDDEYTCWCIPCNKKIDVQYLGEAKLKGHEAGPVHIRKELQSRGTSVEKAIIANHEKDNIEPHVVLAGVMSYGVVKYQLSHSCQDYFSEAIKKVVPRYSGGRDKSGSIIKGAFSISAQESMLEGIRSTPFMSVHFDTSNHDEIKMLPIVCRYFLPLEGVHVRPIDMVSIVGETAETLSNKIIEAVDKVSKYGRIDAAAKVMTINADNAASNFGGKKMKDGKNVATFLKNHFSRDLIKIGCPAHSCNNAYRNAIANLPSKFNVQRICTILYKEFKGNNVRYKKFHALCLKFGLPCLKLLGCSKTRWLSLLPALLNIIAMFPALVEYYRLKLIPKKGKSKQGAMFAKEFFKRKSSFVWLEIVKEHVSRFHTTVLELEGNSTTVLSAIYNIETLIDTCKLLADFPTFESTTRNKFKKLSVSERNELTKFSKQMYKFTGDYLQTWCKSLFQFKIFNWAQILEEAPLNIDEIVKCVDFIRSKGVVFENEANLATEFVQIKAFVTKNLAKWNSSSLKTVQRWVELFKSFHSRSIKLPNFELIVRFLFSISVSNACVERIFSFIKRYWSDSKSNLHFESMLTAVHSKFNLFNNTDDQNYDSASAVWDRIEKDPVLYKRVKSQGKYIEHSIV